jgi:hypothetical protein
MAVLHGDLYSYKYFIISFLSHKNVAEVGDLAIISWWAQSN